ncbi:tetratricopeptide repeat protein [Kangiella sediminilitoris]|nr:tetratricopeptide repeat protein [Kangiella sediminilitoris]
MFKLIIMLVAWVYLNTVQAVDNKNYSEELKEIEAELLVDLPTSLARLEAIGNEREKLSNKEKEHHKLLKAHVLYMTNNIAKAKADLEELESSQLDPEQEAKRLIVLSSIYHHKGESVDAFITLDKSLKLIDSLSDASSEAKILINAVGMYKDADLLEFALEYGRRAIRVANKIKDSRAMCRATYELGAIELLTQNFKMAENRLLMAKSYCEKSNNLIVSYAVNYGLMELNLETSNLKKAEEIAKDLYPKVEEYGWDVLRSATNTLYGKLHLEKNKLNLAEKHGLKAYELAKKIGDKKRTEAASALLAQVYSELDNDKEAIKFYKEYMELNVENKTRVRQRKLAFDIARRGNLN